MGEEEKIYILNKINPSYPDKFWGVMSQFFSQLIRQIDILAKIYIVCDLVLKKRKYPNIGPPYDRKKKSWGGGRWAAIIYNPEFTFSDHLLISCSVFWLLNNNYIHNLFSQVKKETKRLGILSNNVKPEHNK